MMLVTEVINMKETIIKEIEQKLLRYLDNAQMEMLHRTLKSCLDNVTFIMKEDDSIPVSYTHLRAHETG